MGKTILLNGSLASSLVNFRGPLIRLLLARGHRVHVTAPGIDGETAQTLQNWGATVHSIDLARDSVGLLGDLRYCAALRSRCRQTRADLVINYTIKPNIWGAIAAAGTGARSASMVTGLGYAFIPGTGIRRKAMQRIARGLYRIATTLNSVVIFQNPDDQRDFIAAGSLGDPMKARLVDGSGVDIASFAPAPLPFEPVFLMISRFLWTKGLREYAEASLSVLDELPSARCLLVGYGGSGPDVVPEEEIARWQDAGLEVLGELQDVRPALASASIYVLPSYREGTPRSVLEAMAMGRPIITTDAPGCRETVIEGVNGLLIPVGDSAALAQAMRRLAGDAATRSAMGLASRRIAEERYSDITVSEMLVGHLGL